MSTSSPRLPALVSPGRYTPLLGALLAMAGLALLLLTPSPPVSVGRPLLPPSTGWSEWTPTLAAVHPDLAGYDRTCVVRLDAGRATMVACPDGRVGWYDFRTTP